MTLWASKDDNLHYHNIHNIMFNQVTGGTLFWCLHSGGVPNKNTRQIIRLHTSTNLRTAALIFMKMNLLQKMSCHFYCHLNQTILIIILQETYMCFCVYLKCLFVCFNPTTGLDRPWGFQEAEAPRFEGNRHMKVARLSAIHIGNLYPQEIFLVLISVRDSVDPRAIVHLKCT
jgi:hypothetical protein